MKFRNIISSFASKVVPERKVYWMKEKGGSKILLVAVIPEPTEWASSPDNSKKMADMAEGLVMQVAKDVARKTDIVSSGVCMGGNGNGFVSATGIADVMWSPEIEMRLATSGIARVR